MQWLAEACRTAFQKAEIEINRMQEVVTNFETATQGAFQTELQDIEGRLRILEAGYGSGGGAGDREDDIHTDIHTYVLHTYIHKCIHKLIYTYINTHIHTYILTCTHTYINTYITYIHT